MDLNFSEEERSFRNEVREFLRDKLPPALSRKVLSGAHLEREDFLFWQRTLHERGWGGPTWPKEFGGTGWTPVQQYIFEEECLAAGTPRTMPFGPRMLAPVIMKFGSAQQQQRFLPKILSGEEWWCQGYSEPGSGSDLVSLKTRAVRQGDHYLVNGQKIWTSFAHYANWIFCLVRTDPEAKPHSGISFLLIDMNTPGVTVRPIITLDNEHHLNEVWFEDVKVPAFHLIGEENRGWTYAKFLLGHERTTIAGVGTSKRELARLKRIAAAEQKHGRPLLDDPLFAARLAEVEIDLMALEITNLRILSSGNEKSEHGSEASILKIKGTEVQQAITELQVEALGAYSLPFIHESAPSLGQREPVDRSDYAAIVATYLEMRKLSIYGGSNEIQKNIIAQRTLGL
jgi:alkylation response protein AidB-like acyl-CoA dehydrogenase